MKFTFLFPPVRLRGSKIRYRFPFLAKSYKEITPTILTTVVQLCHSLRSRRSCEEAGKFDEANSISGAILNELKEFPLSPVFSFELVPHGARIEFKTASNAAVVNCCVRLHVPLAKLKFSSAKFKL